MYVPPLFAAEEHVARAVVGAAPFATLILPTPAGVEVAPVPVIWEQDQLWGHFARANPVTRHLDGAEVLLHFHGPHAYVSPTWYADPAAHVPTWNYVAAQVRGPCRVLGPEGARDALLRLTARFDPGWAPDPVRLDQLLPAIVAFTVTPVEVSAKLKLSQNRDPDDQRRVRAAINPDVAAWMRAEPGRAPAGS